MNQTALLVVVNELASELKCDRDALIQEVWQLAYSIVAYLPESEIDEQVNNIEVKHRPFDQPGAVVLDDLRTDN